MFPSLSSGADFDHAYSCEKWPVLEVEVLSWKWLNWFLSAPVCAPSGIVTVVSDLSKAIPDALASQTTLLDKTCTPKDVDQTTVLFEFALNSCGTRVQVQTCTFIPRDHVLDLVFNGTTFSCRSWTIPWSMRMRSGLNQTWCQRIIQSSAGIRHTGNLSGQVGFYLYKERSPSLLRG